MQMRRCLDALSTSFRHCCCFGVASARFRLCFDVLDFASALRPFSAFVRLCFGMQSGQIHALVACTPASRVVWNLCSPGTTSQGVKLDEKCCGPEIPIPLNVAQGLRRKRSLQALLVGRTLNRNTLTCHVVHAHRRENGSPAEAVADRIARQVAVLAFSAVSHFWLVGVCRVAAAPGHQPSCRPTGSFGRGGRMAPPPAVSARGHRGPRHSRTKFCRAVLPGSRTHVARTLWF